MATGGRSKLAKGQEQIPGSVWWCDGAALAFEAHFKRRPVLVIAVESGQVHVMPLSSKRRYGQEQAVTHDGGVSFMTGTILTVPSSALHKPLGHWEGFADWQAEQQRIAGEMERARERQARWLNWWKRWLPWLRSDRPDE